MHIRKKYKKYNDILEETVNDINANEDNLDCIFVDFECKDLERCIGRTNDTDEYAYL